MGGQSNDAVKLTNSAIVLELVLVDAAFARSSDMTGVHCSQLTFDALAAH
jgi:hypothetical protein